MEDKIQHFMEKLEISREEAIQLIEDDKRIEKGEKMFELTAEQKKVEKKVRSTTGKKVDAYGKKSTREKKVNNDKLFLIETIQKALTENGCGLGEVVNPEREFEFYFNEVKYKIVMSVPRK